MTIHFEVMLNIILTYCRYNISDFTYQNQKYN